MKQKLLFIFGTRPEAIKLAPLIKECKKYPKDFQVKVCVTSQHREMLTQVLELFSIKPDFDLNLMRPNQSIFDTTADGLRLLEAFIKMYHPHHIIVQGDTTTALVGALAGYYSKIKVSHVEAGLRSGDRYLPFPEEMHRQMISRLTDFHFAPTKAAVANLRREGITKDVSNVGNTVIDALLLGLSMINKKMEERFSENFKFIEEGKRIILVTGHRRESFGKPLKDICLALKKLAHQFPDVEIIYPVHPNPNVRMPVHELLKNIPNIHLIQPLEYPELIWLMNKSYLIITDSGGIQEEAPALGKPILVTREVTERPEIIEAGIGKLVGSDKEKIVTEAGQLLTNQELYRKVARPRYLYGDGKASRKIVQILSKTK